MCVLCARRRTVLDAVLRDVRPLPPDEKARLVSSLQARLRDVLEVVPAGQPATRVRHSDTVYAAPGVSHRAAPPSPNTPITPTRKEA